MKLIAAALCFISISAFAQFDTNYVVKYPEKLALYAYQSRPTYSIDISQATVTDTSGKSGMSYNTVSRLITGFGFDYDKIGLNFGFKTPQPADKRKGNSDYSQLGLSVGGTKFRVEASLNSYRGFYDNESGRYLPSFSDSTAYYQATGLESSSFKIKAFYFLNRKKKFSYSAAYSNSARQLKSAGTLILASNLYSNNMHSDQPIIPMYIDTFYTSWQNLNDIEISGLSLGIGYSHTFVIFKKIYLNLLYTLGVEEQHRKVRTSDNSVEYDSWVTAVSGYDFRSSLGFNADNFFFSFQTIIDGNTYNFSHFNLRSEYYALGFQIGYRFRVKTPGFYKKIQKTGVYKMI